MTMASSTPPVLAQEPTTENAQPGTAGPAFPLLLLKGAPAESRKWVRYPCDLQGTCWPLSHPPSSELLPVQVVDVSAAGIGVILDRPLAAGKFIVVQTRDEAGTSSCTMLGRIVRTMAHGEDRWIAGCA